MIFTKLLFLNDKEMRLLATRNGFFFIWSQANKYFNTYEEAYEYLEDIHEKQYFERKWSNYESFRQSYNRTLKKGKR